MLYVLFCGKDIEDAFASQGEAEECRDEIYKRAPEVYPHLIAVELCCNLSGNRCKRCAEICWNSGQAQFVREKKHPIIMTATNQQRLKIIRWLRDEADRLRDVEAGEDSDPCDTFRALWSKRARRERKDDQC